MKVKATLFSAMLGASLIAQAEVIEISVSQQAPELQNVERPQNGITKSAVENQFGAPQEIIEAVGKPPITTWVYSSFSVYFEYDRVLHSVLHESSGSTE